MNKTVELSVGVGDVFGTILNQNETAASLLWIPGQTWRIYLTCFCCILIYVYTMYLLWHEWVANVALRRAFFLEAPLYGKRMDDLNKIDLQLAKCNKVTHNKKQAYPPWLTHPEIRETPPSVGLFSVLYQLPNSMVTFHV